MVTYLNPDGQSFFDKIDTYLPLAERQRVRDAFNLAKREHGEVRRKSGELFFTHPLTVAYYLSEHNGDGPVLISALLHDVAEDTSVSVDEIRSQFGSEVALIVDGLTKFDEVTAKAQLGRELSKEDVKNATLYKLFAMMTADMRVGFVKIFDRLHNMRTIGSVPPHKQYEKARETLLIYAPLAYRLGMWKVKNELEDLAYAVLEPETYSAFKQQLKQETDDITPKIQSMARRVRQTLEEAEVDVVHVMPAQPDIGSLFERYQANANVSRRQYQNPTILDAVPTLVVLVRTLPDCYLSLGQIHTQWRPLKGRFDDYIADPRENLYQSLHTQVHFGDGQTLRLHIRTVEMQIVANSGMLARWATTNWSDQVSNRVEVLMEAISKNIERDQDAFNDGVRSVLNDVFNNQITVYTPKGKRIELPQGATPVDFAYSIHTEVGHSCRSAKVDGIDVPLNHVLTDGEGVEIVTGEEQIPQRVWLDENLGYIKTSRARSKVRAWFRKLEDGLALAEGELLLRQELNMLGMPEFSHNTLASWFSHQDVDDLYLALGHAEILPTEVSTRVLTATWSRTLLKSTGQEVTAEDGETFIISKADDLALSFCPECQPRPGEPIKGVIVGENAAVVHSVGCPIVCSDDYRSKPDILLGWGEVEDQVRLVPIEIEVYDRSGLLSDIAELMKGEQINITMAFAHSQAGRAKIILCCEMHGPSQMVRILHRMYPMSNVATLRCLGDGEAQKIIREELVQVAAD